MSRQPHRWLRALVVAIVAINSLGIGIVLPVMPELLQQVGQVDIAGAAAVGGWLSLGFASMQLLFGPLLGSLSDRFGRRPVLVLSLVVGALDYAMLALSSALWVFFVVRLMSGAASATFAVVNAVLADRSPPEQRAAHFGLTGAAFGVGFVLGPVVGGVLGGWGPRAPFVLAAGLCAAAALLCVAFLPETLAPPQRRRLRWSDSLPLAGFLTLSRRREMTPLVVVQLLDNVSGLVYPAVWVYFAVARFGWAPSTVGLSLAAYGICMAAIQGGLVRLLVQRFGERRTSMVGLSAGLFGFLLLSRLESPVIAFLLMPLWAVRAVSGTAISGLLSRRMPATEQGELQGMLAGVTGLATLIGIPLMTQVFALANRPGAGEPWPGAPFAMAGAFAALALGLLVLQRGGTVPIPTPVPGPTKS